MKLNVKQLGTAECNTIAAALELYGTINPHIDSTLEDKYLELAATFRHAIVLLCTEGYDAPVDDVQVLGNEKGGSHGV